MPTSERVIWAHFITNEEKQAYEGSGLENCLRIMLIAHNLYTNTYKTKIQTTNVDIYIIDT